MAIDSKPTAPAATTTAAPMTATEQEKDKGAGKGVGPVEKSQPPVAGETIEDLGIGPREPYPSGKPPQAKEHK